MIFSNFGIWNFDSSIFWDIEIIIFWIDMYVILVVQALVFLFFLFYSFLFGGVGELRGGGAEPSLAEKKNGLHWGAE